MPLFLSSYTVVHPFFIHLVVYQKMECQTPRWINPKLFNWSYHFSNQRRPHATGHETPFFAFCLGLWWGDVNVPVNLLTSCMLRELRGLGGVGGMLTSLWTCSRHVCFVNFGVWVGWGDVNIPVNLLTCMLRELRGLGGVGGYLTSLWTCSRHVCFVNFRVWVGWGDVNIPVNLLTSCMLRELRGLGGVGGMLTSPWTCSHHVCFDMLRELRDCLGYIYIYDNYIHNIIQWKSHLDTHICI